MLLLNRAMNSINHNNNNSRFNYCTNLQGDFFNLYKYRTIAPSDRNQWDYGHPRLNECCEAEESGMERRREERRWETTGC